MTHKTGTILYNLIKSNGTGIFFVLLAVWDPRFLLCCKSTEWSHHPFLRPNKYIDKGTISVCMDCSTPTAYRKP